MHTKKNSPITDKKKKKTSKKRTSENIELVIEEKEKDVKDGKDGKEVVDLRPLEHFIEIEVVPRKTRKIKEKTVEESVKVSPKSKKTRKTKVKSPLIKIIESEKRLEELDKKLELKQGLKTKQEMQTMAPQTMAPQTRLNEE